MGNLYRLSATAQEVIADVLEKKAYRFEALGGDFLVSYVFGAQLEGDEESVTPGFGPTGAVMASAYALSRPRKVASLMLSFEDGNNLASVWSASISQAVENQNQLNLGKVQRKLKSGVAKALRVLLDAKSRRAGRPGD